MSSPLVPSKSCCDEQQGNSNEDQNDNESGTAIDDSNANKIFSTVRTHDQVEVNSGEEETSALQSWQTENLPQSQKEHSLGLHYGQGPRSCGQALGEPRQHSPTNRHLSKSCMTDDAKDSLKFSSTHGLAQIHSKTSTQDRSSLIPINKVSDPSFISYTNNVGTISPNERFKGFSLAKSGIYSTKSEPFVKDRILLTPPMDSPSKYLQCSETSNFGIRAPDPSIHIDPLYGLPSHTLSNTSEEKKIVIYSKPPTSDTSVSEFPTGERTTPHVNKHSTLQQPTNMDHHSRLSPKPQVTPEAQLHQGQTNVPSELDSKCLPSKATGQHRAEHFMFGDLSGKRGGTLSESRVSLPSVSASRPQSNRTAKQSDVILCGSPTTLNSNSSSLRQEECIGGKSCNELKTSQDCNHPDSKSQVIETLKNKESTIKPALRKTTSFNESLGNKMYLNKDRVSGEDYLSQDSDSNFFSSSSANALKDKIASVDNRKTAVGRKLQTDVLKASMKESQKNSADTLLCSPIPLSPVAAVNINDQRTALLSSLKDLNTVHTDRLSPSFALPPIESTQLFNISPKASNKTLCNSGIPKPILIHPKAPITNEGEVENNSKDKNEEAIEPNLLVPKPKQVRPKIITYIRRNPQAVDGLPFGQMSMPFGVPSCTVPIPKEHEILSGDIKSSSVLDKYKPDIQKPRIFSAGLMVSTVQPPGHHSLEEVREVHARKDDYCSSTFPHYEVPPSFYRSTMILKPQLGLGAVSRLPSTRSRILIASQCSSSSHITQQEQERAAGSVNSSDTSEDQKKGSMTNGAKSNLPKHCQSGLRPPGYSRMPGTKLTAFGFVRSSSVSSLSSNQSNESIQSDHGRTLSSGTSFANEEQSTQKTVLPSRDAPKGTNKTALQVCSSSMAVPRRSLLPSPKTNVSPAGSKKEAQKEHEVIKPAVSSPKRQIVSTPKLHSPGHAKLRPTIQKNGYGTKVEVQMRDAERQGTQKLKDKYEEQSKKLFFVQEELKKASCGFVVFAVTTQYFFQKSAKGLMKERELAAELAAIREEVALNLSRCEKLQKEKEELEIKFDNEVRKLECQQQEDLQSLKDRLQLQYIEEIECLRKEQNIELNRIQSQHQEQIEYLTVNQEATLSELKHTHTAVIDSMHDDHKRLVHELKESHEYDLKLLEDSFEKLRLSLQDQVETLACQNNSLKDKAKWFEDALKKSTNEQLEITLAPYQHLEKDLNSMKEVLEMKNQLIRKQEKKIMELEVLAETNIILEEKIQVLQQQNEDMKAQIDRNVEVTRQLSAENATLHESVEKESKEKNRLSMTNEELVWKLQSTESMSPTKLPTSPINRSTSSSMSPAKVSSPIRH
ncbi:microtubule-associated tumor suppressor candidate 2-like isoform X2 [Spea bombifrons]|uniref:microtubule-associated tumor suppressor candidate 2-like isoform X2 n=1 Tax=Spea bombifrons TaxID=233779 RepID=UPI002349FD03|nr:microtubule-associated tumor suppressor candidate 2-like isoform X2 [Spea bombifrons]